MEKWNSPKQRELLKILMKLSPDYKKNPEEVDLKFCAASVYMTFTGPSVIDIFENQELIKEYQELIRNKVPIEEELEFVMEHADEINIDKYILIATKHHLDIINNHKSLQDKFKQLLSSAKTEKEQEQARKIYENNYKEYEISKSLYKSLLPLGQNINLVIPDTCRFIKEREIEFADSRILFKNKKINNDIIFSRLISIGKELEKSITIYTTLAELIKLYTYEDILNIFSTREIGRHVIICVQDNFKVGKRKELNASLTKYDKNNTIDPKHVEVLLNIDYSVPIEEIAEGINDAFYKHANYVDIDKFLLLYAYRCEQLLENNKDINDYSKYIMILNIVKNAIINKKYELKLNEVSYTYNDLERLTKRLSNNYYISREDIEYLKNELIKGNINIDCISLDVFQMNIFNEEEFKKFMNNHINNYIYGIRKLNYSTEQAIKNYSDSCKFKIDILIIELYRLKKIDLKEIISLYSMKLIKIDFFIKYANEINLPTEVSVEQINRIYILNKNNEKLSDSYLNTIIEIYKEVYNNNPNDLESMTNNFDDEQDILYYYNQNLIDIDVVAEWCGEQTIENLYFNKDNNISLDKIEELLVSKKVSKLFLEKMILNTNLSDEELMNYVFKNYISKENIIKIFEERAIYIKDAKRLFRLGIIDNSTYKIIRNRDLKKIENRVGRKLSGLVSMEDQFTEEIKAKLSIPNVESKLELKKHKENEHKIQESYAPESLIHPLARLEFLSLLNCRRPKEIKYKEFGENNPFYNYNFYVIQEEEYGDEIRKDAIIIAERFFSNREKEKGTATGNATYIMRYEDYLILQEKQKELDSNHKKQIVQEVPGAIYSVNHRSGSWAMNLIKSIAKARAGSDFEEYTSIEKIHETLDWLHTLYNEDTIANIINYIKEIDDEEKHTYYLGFDKVYRKLFTDNEEYEYSYQYKKENA